MNLYDNAVSQQQTSLSNGRKPTALWYVNESSRPHHQMDQIKQSRSTNDDDFVWVKNGDNRQGVTSRKQNASQIYILTETSNGRRFFRKTVSDVEIERGSLLQSVTSSTLDSGKLSELKTQQPIRDPIYLQSCEFSDLLLCVSESKRFPNNLPLFPQQPHLQIRLLSQEEAAILLAISNFDIRYQFFVNESRLLDFAVRIRLGDRVCVLVGNRRVLGHVVWIGEFDPSRGTHFGIILEEPGIGESDGTYKGLKLFDADVNGAVIVSADRLSSYRNSSVSSNNSKFYVQSSLSMPIVDDLIQFTDKRNGEILSKFNTNNRTMSSINYPQQHHSNIRTIPIQIISNIGDRPNNIRSNDVVVDERKDQAKRQNNIQHKLSDSPIVDIRIGERIVWFNGGGLPQSGTLKWIGRLQGHQNIYAGVEFDEPIGGGTGRFQGVHLFRAQLNHAGFLPISAIMRESDYNKSEYQQQRSMDKYDRKPDELPTASSLASAISIGTCVEANYRGELRFGVVKWIGRLPKRTFDLQQPYFDETDDEDAIGLELEELPPLCWPLTDGTFDGGRRLFVCTGGHARGTFVPMSSVRIDSRFATPIIGDTGDGRTFGEQDSGIVKRYTKPTGDIRKICGRPKGIQGHRNSCYLDATIYAMFAMSTAFDSLLNRPRTSKDICEYDELVTLLANEIVYPLRKFQYVRADRMIKLRSLLSRLLPDIGGLNSEEKDPEEILIALFKRLLKAEPFLKLRNRIDGKTDIAYLCPLVTEDNYTTLESRKIVNIQYLLERSMYGSSVEFAESPELLIIQLPRYGREKVFEQIVPLLDINVTHLVHNGARACGYCDRPAEFLCPECYLTNRDQLLGQVTFCSRCFEQRHHNKSIDHAPASLFSKSTPINTKNNQHQRPLQLFAVLSIATSHYVSFVRVSTNEWVLFDSMADRFGLSDGYNIPEVKLCDSLGSWLTNSAFKDIADQTSIPISDHVRRLLADCYICFYASADYPLYV